MLIAQISDTHILPPASDQPAATLRADCLRRCVADINEQQPDVVLFTGDTVLFEMPGSAELPGGNADDLATSLHRLGELPGDLVLHPGHGRDTTLATALAAITSAQPATPVRASVVRS